MDQILTFLSGNIFIREKSSTSFIPDDRKWCPVRALKWYVHRMKEVRNRTDSSSSLEGCFRPDLGVLFLPGWPRLSRYMPSDAPGFTRSVGWRRQRSCSQAPRWHPQGGSKEDLVTLGRFLPHGFYGHRGILVR